MSPLAEQILRLFELTARESPELLSVFLRLTESYTVNFAVTEIASAMRVKPKQLNKTMLKASQDLDELQRLKRWRHPREVVSRPNLSALRILCHARINNARRPRKRQVLEGIALKLQRAAESRDLKSIHHRILDFIGEPPAVNSER